MINLISRTPSDEAEVLVNVTSKDGQDITTYFSSPITESTSASVTAGVHNQEQQDLDDDGWIDMAGYKRASVRPRFYWQDDTGANLYLTLGVMTEQRTGGTVANSNFPEEGATLPDGNPFAQTQD